MAIVPAMNSSSSFLPSELFPSSISEKRGQKLYSTQAGMRQADSGKKVLQSWLVNRSLLELTFSFCRGEDLRSSQLVCKGLRCFFDLPSCNKLWRTILTYEIPAKDVAIPLYDNVSYKSLFLLFGPRVYRLPSIRLKDGLEANCTHFIERRAHKAILQDRNRQCRNTYCTRTEELLFKSLINVDPNVKEITLRVVNLLKPHFMMRNSWNSDGNRQWFSEESSAEIIMSYRISDPDTFDWEPGLPF